MYLHQMLVTLGPVVNWDGLHFPEWVPVAAGAFAAAGGAFWSAARRWDLALRVETRDGRLRASVSVARRPRKAR